MRCEREGCPDEIEKGRLFMADVFDERRLLSGSAQFAHTGEKDEDGSYIPVPAGTYKGHKQHWCEFCYRSLENNKYILHYTVEGQQMKPIKVLRTADQPADEQQKGTVRDYETTKAVESRKLPDPFKKKASKNVGRGNTKPT